MHKTIVKKCNSRERGKPLTPYPKKKQGKFLELSIPTKTKFVVV